VVRGSSITRPHYNRRTQIVDAPDPATLTPPRALAFARRGRPHYGLAICGYQKTRYVFIVNAPQAAPGWRWNL
jgi:hypothetical protein